MLYIIFAVVIFCFITFILFSSKTTKFSIDREQIRNSTPIEILEIIKKCPIESIESLRFELLQFNFLKNPIISEIIDKIIIERAVVDYDFYAERILISQKKDTKADDLLGYDFSNEFYIAGVHINERKENLALLCQEGDELFLIAEPDNIFDRKAIKVIWNDLILGYIPSSETDYYHNRIISNNDYKAFVQDIIIGDFGRLDCKVAFYIKK